MTREYKVVEVKKKSTFGFYDGFLPRTATVISVGVICMDKILQSGSIRSIRYDSIKQELEIQFLYNGIYRYQKVPLVVYEELLKDFSQDSYIEKQIKPNYQAVKILTV
ncbi:MAG: hypothetical protein K0Q75_2330 [Anaerospora sp.]|nr:hypothetical protein [Anaerospora sp.]